MSATQLRLASFILKEHYGEVVEKVCLCILKKGWTTLGCIKQDTKLGIAKIKKAVCVLLQHNLAKYHKNDRGQVSYNAKISSILTIHQYPKLTYCAKVVFGDAAELIIEELLHHGSMTMSTIVANVTNRLLDPALSQAEQIDYHDVADQFSKLVEKHLIKRSFARNTTSAVITGGENDAQLDGVNRGNPEYDLPWGYVKTAPGKRKRLHDGDDGPAVKRRKNEPVSIDFEDSNILWQVNVVMFHHYLVNELVENAVKNRVDEFAAGVVKMMLKHTMLSRDGYAAQTKSLSVFDVSEKLTSNSSKVDSTEIVKYLSLLEDDQAGFVSKTGDNCGGMYAVNIRKSVEAVCTQTIESVIRERCGSKSLRIFKLLLMKQHLEQKQVEDLMMVPVKEAKELLYNLLSEKFINLQEIPRATDYAPSRTFYLFSANVPQVARMLLDRCYKTLGNLISRRYHETEEHKRLVEKSEKINATILALKSQGMDDNSPAVQEVEEMMTPQEKQQLAKLKTVLAKLEQSELQVGDTVLVFTQYLALHS